MVCHNSLEYIQKAHHGLKKFINSTLFSYAQENPVEGQLPYVLQVRLQFILFLNCVYYSVKILW
jgi:hypothetical protein